MGKQATNKDKGKGKGTGKGIPSKGKGKGNIPSAPESSSEGISVMETAGKGAGKNPPVKGKGKGTGTLSDDDDFDRENRQKYGVKLNYAAKSAPRNACSNSPDGFHCLLKEIKDDRVEDKHKYAELFEYAGVVFVYLSKDIIFRASHQNLAILGDTTSCRV